MQVVRRDVFLSASLAAFEAGRASRSLSCLRSLKSIFPHLSLFVFFFPDDELRFEHCTCTRLYIGSSTNIDMYIYIRFRQITLSLPRKELIVLSFL